MASPYYQQSTPYYQQQHPPPRQHSYHEAQDYAAYNAGPSRSPYSSLNGRPSSQHGHQPAPITDVPFRGVLMNPADPGAQAWNRYYSQGGTDPAGLVYFIPETVRGWPPPPAPAPAPYPEPQQQPYAYPTQQPPQARAHSRERVPSGSYQGHAFQPPPAQYPHAHAHSHSLPTSSYPYQQPPQPAPSPQRQPTVLPTAQSQPYNGSWAPISTPYPAQPSRSPSITQPALPSRSPANNSRPLPQPIPDNGRRMPPPQAIAPSSSFPPPSSSFPPPGPAPAMTPSSSSGSIPPSSSFPPKSSFPSSPSHGSTLPTTPSRNSIGSMASSSGRSISSLGTSGSGSRPLPVPSPRQPPAAIPEVAQPPPSPTRPSTVRVHPQDAFAAVRARQEAATNGKRPLPPPRAVTLPPEPTQAPPPHRSGPLPTPGAKVEGGRPLPQPIPPPSLDKGKGKAIETDFPQDDGPFSQNGYSQSFATSPVVESPPPSPKKPPEPTPEEKAAAHKAEAQKRMREKLEKLKTLRKGFGVTASLGAKPSERAEEVRSPVAEEPQERVEPVQERVAQEAPKEPAKAPAPPLEAAFRRALPPRLKAARGGSESDAGSETSKAESPIVPPPARISPPISNPPVTSRPPTFGRSPSAFGARSPSAFGRGASNNTPPAVEGPIPSPTRSPPVLSSPPRFSADLPEPEPTSVASSTSLRTNVLISMSPDRPSSTPSTPGLTTSGETSSGTSVLSSDTEEEMEKGPRRALPITPQTPRREPVRSPPETPRQNGRAPSQQQPQSMALRLATMALQEEEETERRASESPPNVRPPATSARRSVSPAASSSTPTASSSRSSHTPSHSYGGKSLADDLDDKPPESLRRSPSPSASRRTSYPAASSPTTTQTAAPKRFQPPKRGNDEYTIPSSSRSLPQRPALPLTPQKDPPTRPVSAAQPPTRPMSTAQQPTRPMSTSQHTPRATTTQATSRPLPSASASRPLPSTTRPLPTSRSNPPSIPSPSCTTAPPVPVPVINLPDDEPSGPVISVAPPEVTAPSISVSISEPVVTPSRNTNGTHTHTRPTPATPRTTNGTSRPQPATPNGRVGATASSSPYRKGSSLRCAGCDGLIVGRIVSAMDRRWHPACFKCSQCNELLEHVSSYEHEGKAYCHLDYHELFAPRCFHCGTSISEERFVTVTDPGLDNGKTRYYHELHFFCAECGDPFLHPSSSSAAPKGQKPRPHEDAANDLGYTVYKGHAYCEACHVRLRMPKCNGCGKSIRDEVVEALDRKWHFQCFCCTTCRQPFEDPSFFVRGNDPYCDGCYRILLKSEI